jgi:hypothetical protein
MVTRSLVDVALACYPRWWKERYGDEMRAVIDDLKDEGRSEHAIAAGLLRDAMRSRLQARGMPRTYGLLANRTRTSVAVGTLPWLAIMPFVLSITGNYLLHPFRNDVIVGYPFQLSPFPTKVFAHNETFHPAMSIATWVGGFSVMAVQALFIVTLIILGVGLSALRYGIKREKGRNRRWMYLLTWAPFVTVFGLVGLGIGRTFVSANEVSSSKGVGSHQVITWVGGHPAIAALMGDLEWTLAIGGWLLAMGGLAVVANRANVPPDTLRFGRTVSVLTSISMSLTFLAFIVWSVAIDIQVRQGSAAGSLVATYPRHDMWLPMAFALGLASAASIWGASTARRSWRTIRLQRLWET